MLLEYLNTTDNRMKSKCLTYFLLLFCLGGFGQKTTPKAVNPYASIDKKALQIPDSLTKTTDGIASYINSTFSNENDKARAIFIWVATNIQYDYENMFAINFYEKKEEKISKPLKTRKGICENYAYLFNDICLKSGIKSFVIEGYTKQNGFTDYIPHAWCSARIDSTYFIFDPTWGSGGVINGKFVKQINNYYFKALPSSIIKSHMPFDYLWQFLNYPITNQEFYDGKVQQNKSKPFFNYLDSIKEYEKLSKIEQLIASAGRTERNGVKNSMIFDRLAHIKMEIAHYNQERTVNSYNSAVSEYNDGINLLNDFIQYRNKQFNPAKTDKELQEMVDSPYLKLSEAKSKLNEIKGDTANVTMSLTSINKSIDDAIIHVNEQKDFVKQYLSKGKLGRKTMFTKYTWFGIPLN